ncbi:MAG TPA: hypothetical protein VGZ25_17150 [Gemmataceae bacterium]|nr:hypothetical protein [Gemmataceae bacterium]
MALSRWQSFTPVFNQLQQLSDDMNPIFGRWGENGSRFFESLSSFGSKQMAQRCGSPRENSASRHPTQPRLLESLAILLR